MISLISEITDSKGRRATRGWLFFDAECSFCMSVARRLRPILEPRGFGIAALQDPRAQQHLSVASGDLLSEMKLLTADGRQLGGADAIVFVARHVQWGWPFWAIGQIPGIRHALRAGYRAIAARRHCLSGTCERLKAHTARSGFAR